MASMTSTPLTSTIPTQIPAPSPSTAPLGAAPPDAFALAARRLAAQRPLRDRQLQACAQHLDHGHLELARSVLDRHLARQPADVDALHLLARAALRMNRRAEAYELLARCLRIAPDFAAARFNRANMLVRDWRFDEALDDLGVLLRTDPRNPLFRQVEANVLETIGDNERSLAVCEELAQENPRRFESWLSVGHARRATGRRAQCVEAYRQALALRPACGRAWWSIADLRTVAFDDADVAAMQALLQRSDVPVEDRAACLCALGKAFEDRGDPARAFERFEQGNALLRHRIVYDADAQAAGIARRKALFTPEFFARRRAAGAGAPAPDPIFVLGRPRSGSTLVEQILASHPAIEGTAELPYLGALADGLGAAGGTADPFAALAALEPAALTALGDEYLRRARLHRRAGRPFFIDKMPGNFLHVGLIALILPNARIIDARRDPAATSFSIFRNWRSRGALNLDELGRFYRDYVALMAHFDAVLPGRVHRVIHEDLLREPEAEIRRLLDALGLPFDERCLRFHETQRAVLTPSSEQVRRPLTAEGVGRWRIFEPWLGPLLDSLGSVQTAYPEVPDELR
jgi:tetratricopeptide (TPR) repeat protein